MSNGNWFLYEFLVKEREIEIAKKSKNAWWFYQDVPPSDPSYLKRFQTWLGLGQPVVKKQAQDCATC